MIDNTELFTSATYSAYRKHAKSNDYCSPWIPQVGPKYGGGDFPKFVYCGVGAWWGEYDFDPVEGADEASYQQASEFWTDFYRKADHKTRFFDLFDKVLELLDSEKKFSAAERRERAVWTNLSKTGSPNNSSPPASDTKLRALDVAQIQHEIELLTPDLFLCVSGNMLLDTSLELFSKLEKTDFKPDARDPWVRRFPHKGLLYWTMHPNRKPAAWQPEVLADLAALIPGLPHLK